MPAIRKGLRFILLGVVFGMIAAVFPTKDQFVFTLASQKRVISRQRDPLIYWGTEAAIGFTALAFVAAGVYYRQRA